MKAVRAASKETLEALPWLPQPVAEALWEKLHGPAQAKAPDRRATNLAADEEAVLEELEQAMGRTPA